jgi:cell division ATPase FtsA
MLMSLFSFLQKNKEDYSLVFNIGSGSISGGIIKFTEEPGENIIYYVKESIPFQSEISVEKYLELMKSTLTKIADKIHNEGLKNLNIGRDKGLVMEKVFYMFSSPWSISQTKTIKIKESRDFKITKKYLSRVINEQEKLFETDISKFGKIIEKKIVQVKINGYEVNDFYDKSAKDLEISLFFTVVPENVLFTVEDAVSKTFNIKNIWCHSSALSIFSVIRNLFPQKDDFIQLDISEEMTDIAIIKDNIILSSASIPFGRNHFIRGLSRELKVTEEIADSQIRMCCSNDHDKLASINISVAMDRVSADWLAKTNEIINNFKEKIYISESVFLVTNSDLIPFLKGKLQKQDFEVLLIDNKNITPPMIVDDIIFKLELMFLDNLYKI